MAEQIAQPQQNIERPEAIGHEQLLVRHFRREAVGQQRDFTEICRRAEEIHINYLQIAARTAIIPSVLCERLKEV